MNAAERITNPLPMQPGWMTRREGRDENGNLPILNMTYDGQEQMNIMTRLEAFRCQTKQYHVQHRA
jgi:hypothetical protein